MPQHFVSGFASGRRAAAGVKLFHTLTALDAFASACDVVSYNLPGVFYVSEKSLLRVEPGQSDHPTYRIEPGQNLRQVRRPCSTISCRLDSTDSQGPGGSSRAVCTRAGTLSSRSSWRKRRLLQSCTSAHLQWSKCCFHTFETLAHSPDIAGARFLHAHEVTRGGSSTAAADHETRCER